MFDTCFLHVGFWKTGTTSIQHSLQENARNLELNGIAIPKALGGVHNFLASRFHHAPATWELNRVAGRTTREALDVYHATESRAFDRYCTRSAARSLVLSCEHLTALNADSLRNLRSYLQGYAKRIVVVCYVRHPIAHACSAMQEQIKEGWATLSQCLRPPRLFIKARPVLERLTGVFGEKDLIVREFARDHLFQGDGIADFLLQIGVAPSEITSFKRVAMNEAVSHEALLIASALNERWPRLSGERGPSAYLRRIPGSRFVPPKWWIERVTPLAADDVEYLRSTFGMEMRPPHFGPADGANSLWGAETIAAIASELNSLSRAADANSNGTKSQGSPAP